MKKINIYQLILPALFSMFMFSCSEDGLGEDYDISGNSLIPQKLAGEAVDNRIMDYFNRYGSYFLYDFTPEQATWSIVKGYSSGYEFVTADLNHVNDGLNLLEKTFLNLYNEDFLRKTLPLKIFLADQISAWGWMTYNAYSTGTSFVFSGFNASASSMESYELISYCQDVNNAYLGYLVSSNKITIPSDFYQLTDYSVDLQSWNSYPSDITPFSSLTYPTDDMLNAGILCSMSSWEMTSGKMENDVKAYLGIMRYLPKSSPEFDRLMSYPLVKQKYDLIHNAVMDKFGYDMQIQSVPQF